MRESLIAYIQSAITCTARMSVGFNASPDPYYCRIDFAGSDRIRVSWQYGDSPAQVADFSNIEGAVDLFLQRLGDR